MQVVVKNNDLASLLSSPIFVIEHEEYRTIEQMDIIAVTISSKQK
jgi:hypothetical protein